MVIIFDELWLLKEKKLILIGKNIPLLVILNHGLNETHRTPSNCTNSIKMNQMAARFGVERFERVKGEQLGVKIIIFIKKH